MTPKEKAKELVYKFYPSVQWKLGQEDCLDRAKRCALIAVNEILNFRTFLKSMPLEDIKYWQEVKKEIEKL
jgi:hypothetical protein